MSVIDTNTLIALTIAKGAKRLDIGQFLDEECIAPTLCKTEFVHVLLKYLKANLISYQQAEVAIETMLAIIKFDCFSRPEDILALAKTFKITAYDAEFVSLAIERDTQLVTFDKALLNTFPDICKKPIQ